MRYFALMSLILCTACAQVPAPTGQLARSQAAIRNAQALDASNYAPLELSVAETKLKQGSEQINLDNAIATRLLEQSELDARLAAEKTLSAKAQSSLNEIQSKLPADPIPTGVQP